MNVARRLPGTKEEQMVESLTVETFKQKVFDFEENKEWTYKGDKPAVIDFYADWCGPCKAQAPIIDELASEYDGKVDFYKIDTEKEQNLAAMFGIQSIPSLLFVPKDAQPQMNMGMLPKENLISAMSSVFGI